MFLIIQYAKKYSSKAIATVVFTIVVYAVLFRNNTVWVYHVWTNGHAMPEVFVNVSCCYVCVCVFLKFVSVLKNRVLFRIGMKHFSLGYYYFKSVNRQQLLNISATKRTSFAFSLRWASEWHSCGVSLYLCSAEFL